MTTPDDRAWRQDFLRLFSSGVKTDFGAAMALKKEHLPSHLFKFFPPTKYSFEALTGGTVWLASPSTFNDPFDSGLTIEAPTILADLAATSTDEIEGLTELGISGAQLGQLILGKGDQAFVEMLSKSVPENEREGLKALLDVIPQVVKAVSDQSLSPRLQEVFQRGLKIGCFTEHATSLLLWAHYAQSHQGFCAQYAVGNLLPTQQRLLFPVFYSSKRFNVSPLLRRFSAGELGVPNHAIVAALHKAAEWAYEEEWRIVHPDGRDLPGVAIAVEKPVRIYAGLRMAAEPRQRLEGICAAQGIELVEVALSPDRYEVLIPAASPPAPPSTPSPPPTPPPPTP